MNRESLPLLITMMVPVVLVIIVLLYNYGYDITEFFRNLDILYYIVFIPIVLGFIVAVIKYMRPD